MIDVTVSPCFLDSIISDCMEARDPYCGWDHKLKRCTTIEGSSNVNYWTQNITECPVRPKL